LSIDSLCRRGKDTDDEGKAENNLSAAQNENQGTKQESKHDKKLSRTTGADSGEDEGQRVFAEHCSRCHNAPEGFSPRIAGTITRHMRVRANLTAEEERAVLRFFNP
jgi:cytochrome c5